MNDLIRQRLHQAQQALEEAQALLDNGMDRGFVLTQVSYAFYYPVLALLNEGKVPETMQSVTLGQFEQQYIRTGRIPPRFHESLCRVFDIKPKCSGERTPVGDSEIEALIATAQGFHAVVRRLLESDPTCQETGITV